MSGSGIATPFGGEYESTQAQVAKMIDEIHSHHPGCVHPFDEEERAMRDPATIGLTVPYTPDVVAAYQAVIDAWGIPAGSVMVVRDRVERDPRSENDRVGDYVAKEIVRDDGTLAKLYGTDWQGGIEQQFMPWATVLMVGEPYVTDYGHTVQPPPISPGMRVLITATAAEDIDLEAGDSTMRVTLVSFRAIKLWRKG